MFATVTNILAYIPFLLLTGTMGEFLYSLPIVMACSLSGIAAGFYDVRPLLGYYLLRPDKKPEKPIEVRRTTRVHGLVCEGSEGARWSIAWETKKNNRRLESPGDGHCGAYSWPPPRELNRNFITPRPIAHRNSRRILSDGTE